MVSPPASSLPYAQATAAQRAQALHQLQARLQLHFPTLPERSFARVLAEFRPDLLLTPTQVGFLPLDLTQLVQALTSAPELPLLDPPLYGQPALALAQHSLHTSELAVQTLVEFVTQPSDGSQLVALLQRLTTYYPLAEQVVQAWRWNVPSSPALPPGLPSGGPTPGSRAVTHLLQQLVRRELL
jgi:hypothetical protein